MNIAVRPIGGRLSLCAHNWSLIGASVWVQNTVRQGYKIQWIDGLPDTPFRSRNPPVKEGGDIILTQEVAAMIAKNAIHQVEPSEDEVVSGYFAREKKTPGKWRPIVSLKYTNSFIRYQKFRMTTTWDIKKWIRPGSYFVSLDLTDAYFGVPLHKSGWRFTRFVWEGKTYEYLVIMFGLQSSQGGLEDQLQDVTGCPSQSLLQGRQG